MGDRLRYGAWLDDGAARWRVWAPGHESVELVLYEDDGSTVRRSTWMQPDGNDCFTLTLRDEGAGTLYRHLVDGEGPFPDPWSRSQPYGVHGPSEIPGERFDWTDDGWRGVPLEELVIWEAHVGTATPEGTFEGLIGKLEHVRSLGATAIELMPVASFPGLRNWGYDGVQLFAPQAVYGGPYGLKRLVNAAHGLGLAVLLDVVYNHFGPDGNYLARYSSRYFTHVRQTPWGDAIHYDGEGAEPVRELFLSNAEMWIRDYHLDGLRLDATHQIHDDAPTHLLGDIARRARSAAPDRTVLLIAEDERNDVKLVLPADRGGFGLDAVWADDFHHEMRRALTGDRDGYFADFTGSADDIARTLRDGWFFQGQPSTYWKGPRGTPPDDVPLPRFVHCIQNHDQVGNRALGDRLNHQLDAAGCRAAAALLLIAPSTPLLFMGQEWSASTPFRFFTDHEPRLGRAITEGRRNEFAAFTAFDGQNLVPDPQSLQTFQESRLDWSELDQPEHAAMLAWYRELLSLRQNHPALRSRRREDFIVDAAEPATLVGERRSGDARLRFVVNLNGSCELEIDDGWRVLLHSEETRFGGSGSIPVDGGRIRFSRAGAVLFTNGVPLNRS